VALAGGLLDPDRALRERVRQEILARVPEARVQDAPVDGAHGAAELARARLGEDA
jgi:hypothetical protein